LIATNGKELNALIAKGDRTYVKFDHFKKTKAPEARRHRDSAKEDDPGRGQYSLDVIADDKKPVEKRDKASTSRSVLCRLEVEPGLRAGSQPGGEGRDLGLPLGAQGPAPRP